MNEILIFKAQGLFFGISTDWVSKISDWQAGIEAKAIDEMLGFQEQGAPLYKRIISLKKDGHKKGSSIDSYLIEDTIGIFKIDSDSLFQIPQILSRIRCPLMGAICLESFGSSLVLIIDTHRIGHA